MIIFIAIGFALLFYALFDLKKAFMLFLMFRLFLDSRINIVNLPGVPLLTLELVMCSMFICIYLVMNYFKKVEADKNPFPLKIAFIFLSISLTFSSIFGIAGFATDFTNLIKQVIENYLTVWLIWVLLNKKSDYIFLLKGLALVFLIAGLYGIFEIATLSNPYTDFKNLISGGGDKFTNTLLFHNDPLRGYRINSIFSDPISGGMYWSLMILVIIYLTVYFKKTMRLPHILLIIVTCISLICLFFTKSRAPLVFLLLGLLPCLFFINKRIFVICIAGIIVVAGVYFWDSSVFTNFFSLYDSSAQREVGGSTYELRATQMAAAWDIFKDAPVFGHGLHSMTYLPTTYARQNLIDADGLWMLVLVSYGIVGVAATLFLIFCLIYQLGIKKRNRFVIILSIAFFITESFSNSNFNEWIFYAFIFMFLKMEGWQKIELFYRKKYGRINHYRKLQHKGADKTMPAVSF
ncbi:MAG: O-antigen ligase family protein [Dysgonamonadaceae bacterium]|jgi:hypothetical protein|nr:O-antigen ligase family protein [Dysgonamonadaceae bacterium]